MICIFVTFAKYRYNHLLELYIAMNNCDWQDAAIYDGGP